MSVKFNSKENNYYLMANYQTVICNIFFSYMFKRKNKTFKFHSITEVQKN